MHTCQASGSWSHPLHRPPCAHAGEVLEAMTLGEAAVREALRIAPSVTAIFRRAEQDLEVCGYAVPKVRCTRWGPVRTAGRALGQLRLPLCSVELACRGAPGAQPATALGALPTQLALCVALRAAKHVWPAVVRRAPCLASTEA